MSQTTHAIRKTDPRPPPTSDAVASGLGSGPGVCARCGQSTFREGELRSKSMSHALLFSGLSVARLLAIVVRVQVRQKSK
jgi:hypothetical protein